MEVTQITNEVMLAVEMKYFTYHEGVSSFECIFHLSSKIVTS